MGKIVDVWEGNDVNWSLASQHISLAILRVQYGSKKKDTKYDSHVAGCEANGVVHAAYAYGRFVSIEDAIVEANDFMNRVSKNAKFLVLDVEKDTLASCGSSNLSEASQAFIDTCRKAGWKIGLYVSHDMYRQHGLDGVQADFLWIPRYGVNDGTPSKKPDYACDLWQYTDKGSVPGITGDVDLNELYSDKSLDWFKGEEKLLKRIVIDGLNELTWAGNVKQQVKDMLPGYGVWDDTVNDVHRLFVGDFNNESWYQHTLTILKERFQGYAIWTMNV